MLVKLSEPQKVCIITGRETGLHKHHVYRGPYRAAAEKWRCYIYLAPDWHVGTRYCIHNDQNWQDALKREYQLRLMAAGWTKEEFVETFGRNYL